MDLKLIPEANMAKAPSYNTVSKAVQATRDKFDGFIKAVPAGQAGVLVLSEDDNAKSVQMSLRQASKRLKLAGGNGLVKVVHATAPERIEFTVGKAAVAAPLTQPAPQLAPQLAGIR